jgi:hypothetical protein
MDPERTTTIGLGESAAMLRPFHIMKAVLIMNAKLSSCVANDRGDMLEDMANVKGSRGYYPMNRTEYI